jgi:phosphoglycerol transferase
MKNLKKFSPYLAAPTLALLLFILFFQAWKIDFSQPIFSYSADTLLSAFEIKTVLDEGWFFSNSFVGLPHITEKFYLHDFPLQADSFHFFIVKIFSYFSSNPFLIINCFFIFTFILISATSFVALRAFGISNFSATLISILYAFTPYHIARNVNHLFLSNYAVIPLVIMAALWIATDKIRIISIDKKKRYCLAPNRFFFIALTISIFVAMNGIYYAIYSAAIFIFAWFLRALQGGKFLNENGFSVLVLCFAIFFALACLYLPSFYYWFEHGLNSGAAIRDRDDSEFFGLKISSLFLPAGNHYIEYFAKVRGLFNEYTFEAESACESLGILGSVGFLFLLLWLLGKSFFDEKGSFLQKTIQKFSLKRDEQNLIAHLAGLNLLVVFFATVGGLVMFIAIPFPLIRSHARFSIFIAFLALFLIAIIFDKIIESKKKYAKIFVALIAFFALFDQVGRVPASSIQSESMTNKFRSDRDFVEKIEQAMPQGAMIFELPIVCFPECAGYDMMIGYLHSQKLRWSFPAMNGREVFDWQKKVSALEFENFIAEIKKIGFEGVYLDRAEFISRKKNWGDLRSFEAKLKSASEGQAIVSQNLRLVFFRI